MLKEKEGSEKVGKQLLTDKVESNFGWHDENTHEPICNGQGHDEAIGHSP